MRASRRRASTRTAPIHPLLRALRIGASTALVLMVVGLATLVIGVPLATGAVPLTVLTNSMAPTYPPGTLVIVRPVDTTGIRIGDPITYQIRSGQPEVITHRVISIASSGGTSTFTTQGDNNDLPDSTPVVPDQVMGTVWYSVPWVGYLNNAVGANRDWIVPAIAVALFLFAGYSVTGGLVDASRTRRRGRSVKLSK
jgi:signal peptidase